MRDRSAIAMPDAQSVSLSAPERRRHRSIDDDQDAVAGCMYDLRVTFCDGRRWIWQQVDVCRYRSLRLRSRTA